MMLLLVLFVTVLLVRPSLVVLSLAAVNATAERVLAQIVPVHRVRRGPAAVHRVRSRSVVAQSAVIVVVAAVVLVVVVVVAARLPSGSVSVQRLRAAEQTLLALAAVRLLLLVAAVVVVGRRRTYASVVTPVGVLAVPAAAGVVLVVVVFVVVVVAAPRALARRRRVPFLPVLLTIARVRRLAAAVSRELAHQPTERLAERFLPLIPFVVVRCLQIRNVSIHFLLSFSVDSVKTVDFVVLGFYYFFFTRSGSGYF